MKAQKTQGFTLVEIAIVLVIIGLLLGGILKGQEMITQAKIKNVIADFSGVSAAYHGYVDRYKKIPGDDPCAGGTVVAAICGTLPALVGAATARRGGNSTRRRNRASSGTTCAAPASSPATAASSRSTRSPACSACRPATAPRRRWRRCSTAPPARASSA
jgi:prepilin-type N-terminal cleavage/methylation domain-containing protein